MTPPAAAVTSALAVPCSCDCCCCSLALRPGRQAPSRFWATVSAPQPPQPSRHPDAPPRCTNGACVVMRAVGTCWWRYFSHLVPDAAPATQPLATLPLHEAVTSVPARPAVVTRQLPPPSAAAASRRGLTHQCAVIVSTSAASDMDLRHGTVAVALHDNVRTLCWPQPHTQHEHCAHSRTPRPCCCAWAVQHLRLLADVTGHAARLQQAPVVSVPEQHLRRPKLCLGFTGVAGTCK